MPRVKTALETPDVFGSLGVRLGIGRNRYTIAPGLYGVGSPGSQSPVLVTANYKLTFDTLRRALDGIDAWILVLDTRGINVWCAAGKGTFSTAELVRRVKQTGLERLVAHRRLVLPQLAATGVAGHRVKKHCGFEVVWGPVRAADLKRFLASGDRADDGMRRVTFSLWERLVLIPVEIAEIRKYLLWAGLAVFALSGLGPGWFSVQAVWQRGILLAGACAVGIAAGALAVPLLLPWLPARAFALKGAQTGAVAGLLTLPALWGRANALEILALMVCTTAVGSFLGMNFTGATPFTSPSGVEKEMRRAIPLQTAALVVAAGLWVAGAFV